MPMTIIVTFSLVVVKCIFLKLWHISNNQNTSIKFTFEQTKENKKSSNLLLPFPPGQVVLEDCFHTE
jgi:hypothetical protein